MGDAILRNLTLLRAIPRHPRKCDVASLHRALEAAGYRITRRQVQRDLERLSGIFAIRPDVEERGHARGWSWDLNAALLDLPGMDPRTALMLKLVQQFVPQLLPPTVSDALQPYFRKAEETLRSGADTGFGRWTDCVRVVPREMPLLAPKLDPAVARVVYDALLQGRRFRARYASRSADGKERADVEINPLGLVVRGNLIYLVCTFWTYTDVRQIPLHRIRSAALLEMPVSRPEGFDLDDYIRSGVFQYPNGEATGKTIVLKVRFDRHVAAHLAETPLSADQKIEPRNADKVVVTATVQDTQQLEWWLRAFGDAAEVLAPRALRNRLKTTLARAAKRYQTEARKTQIRSKPKTKAIARSSASPNRY
jgi:predicted DNA-binding transcriptional regulator YafY